MSKPTKPELKAKSKRDALLDDLSNNVEARAGHPIVVAATKLSKYYRGFVASPDSEYKQLYRALAGVPACILEGFGRGPGGYRTNFFLMARGSAYEALGHAMILDSDHVNVIIDLCNEIDQLMRENVTDE